MASYTSSLRLVLPATGEYPGTWGTQANNGLTNLVDTSIAGTSTITMTAADYTLSTANGASDEARSAVLNVVGTPGAARNIIVPAVSKLYVVFNNTTGGFAQTVKTSAGTGVSVPNGATAYLRCDGTNVVAAVNYFGSLTLGTALPVGSGGTGATTIPALSVFVANTLNTLTTVTPGAGQSVRVNAGNTAWEAFTPGSGDVTAAGNNAFTGANTFYNATGQTFGTATSTQDGIIVAGRAGGSSSYRVTLQPTTLTASRTLTLPDATSTVAVLGLAQTFTAQQTLSGSTSVLATALTNAAEVATISATAATGTINYDITTQSVLYYTSNASANWTTNFRASSGTSLNTAMSTGQSVTVAFLVTQGATAYYNNVVQVDGTTSGVTTRWIGGAPTAGNASGIDSYRYVIIKTGSATFTVLASVTQFKA
jgi:hypothetical protein